MEFEILRLEPANAAAFAALRAESLRAYPSLYSMGIERWERAPLESVEAALEFPDETNGFVLGVFVEGALVGSLGLQVQTRWKAAHMGTLWAMYLREGLEGHGIGRAMFAALVERARPIEPLEQLRVMVPVEFERVRGLLVSCGFEAYGLERRGRRTEAGYHDLEYLQMFLRTP